MNSRVLAVQPSLIREVAAKKRPSSIDLGLGEPSLRPNERHFDKALRYIAEHGVKYTPNAGEPALREAIAHHYRYPGIDRVENVCVTTGSQEAMFVSLKTLLEPGRDELLVVEPTFPSYAKMASIEGASVRSIAMLEEEDFAFDAERIAGAVGERTRALVICSPCNPTARVISRAQALELARILERRGGDPVWLIHDEIYREQTFVDDPGFLAQHYAHTIVTNSVSKSNALTGLRLGWIIGPSHFVEQAIKVHAWATSCADTFAQQVALDVIGTRGGLQEHAGWYRENHRKVVAALQASGLRFIVPEGSFYACVRLPGGTSSLAAAHELIERYDLVAIPGIAFGDAMEGWLRLSWVGDAARVREGIARICEYCGL